jgi:hypothetical protein
MGVKELRGCRIWSRSHMSRSECSKYVYWLPRVVGIQYVIDENTSHTPEESTHSPSWPNGLVIIITIIIIAPQSGQ